MYVIFLHVYTRRAWFNVSSEWLLWGIASAQNFHSRETCLQSAHKALHKMVTPSIWWHMLGHVSPGFWEWGLSLCATDSPWWCHIPHVLLSRTMCRLSRVLWRCASCPIMFCSACVMLARHVVLHCRPNVCDVVMMKLQFLLCPR